MGPVDAIVLLGGVVAFYFGYSARRTMRARHAEFPSTRQHPWALPPTASPDETVREQVLRKRARRDMVLAGAIGVATITFVALAKGRAAFEGQRTAVSAPAIHDQGSMLALLLLVMLAVPSMVLFVALIVIALVRVLLAQRHHRDGVTAANIFRATSYTEKGRQHLARAARESLLSLAALVVAILAWTGLALIGGGAHRHL